MDIKLRADTGKANEASRAAKPSVSKFAQITVLCCLGLAGSALPSVPSGLTAFDINAFNRGADLHRISLKSDEEWVSRGGTYTISRSILDETYSHGNLRYLEQREPDAQASGQTVRKTDQVESATGRENGPSLVYDNRCKAYPNPIRASRGENDLRTIHDPAGRSPAGHSGTIVTGQVRAVRNGIVYMSDSANVNFSYGQDVDPDGSFTMAGMEMTAGEDPVRIELATNRGYGGKRSQSGFKGYTVKKRRMDPTNKGYSASRGYGRRHGDHGGYYHRGPRRGAEFFVGGIVIQDSPLGGMRQIAGEGGMNCAYGEYCTIDLGGPKIINFNDIGDIENGEVVEPTDK
jgi:hypothetical protein